MTVPSHMFSRRYLDGNFQIPDDLTIRLELIQQLREYSTSEALRFPLAQDAKAIILARLAALEAYEVSLHLNTRT